MRAKKFARLRGKKSSEVEVDITSLLDILVILLIFLLKSYNSSDLQLDVLENISLPVSESRVLGSHSIIVQVDQNRRMFINHKEIGTISNNNRETIGELYVVLARMKEMEDQLVSENSLERKNPQMKNKKQINIVLDQSLPYKIMKKVMHTSAQAGYPQFKFIVQGMSE